MKISALLIAASVVVGALGAGAASADHGDRHDNGRHRGYERHDGGHRDGMRDHRRHCRTEWRHHRRVTRCY